MGILYGKREHLQRLRPYKLRANSDAAPFRWEWGTLNHECIAGITACVDYLADIGREVEFLTPRLCHPAESIALCALTAHPTARAHDGGGADPRPAKNTRPKALRHQHLGSGLAINAVPRKVVRI